MEMAAMTIYSVYRCHFVIPCRRKKCRTLQDLTPDCDDTKANTDSAQRSDLPVYIPAICGAHLAKQRIDVDDCPSATFGDFAALGYVCGDFCGNADIAR
jgi:hypothetical protein